MSLWDPTPEERKEGEKVAKEIVERMKTVTPEELDVALKRGQQRYAEYQKKRKECPYKPRQGVCVVCGAVVTETYSMQYDPNTGPLRYGGTGQHKWTSSGLSCQDCGLVYKKLPKKK